MIPHRPLYLHAVFYGVVAALAFSCGESLPAPEGIDAPARDGGGNDAESADAAPTASTFCTTRSASAILCDDFEQPGRKATDAPSPWTRFTTVGAQLASIGAGADSPSALKITGRIGDGDHSRLEKEIALAGKHVVIELDLRVDDLLDSDAARPQLVFASLLFAGGKYLVFKLYPYPHGTSTLRGFLVHRPLIADPDDYWLAPASEQTIGGGWTHLALDIDARTDTASVRVRIGPSEVVDPPWTFPVDQANALLTIGAELDNEPADTDVSFDNVLVREL